MHRRDFLRLLLSTPIAATLDVEKLLWVPSTQVVVPELPVIYGTIGAINRAAYSFWRTQQLCRHWPFDLINSMRALSEAPFGNTDH